VNVSKTNSTLKLKKKQKTIAVFSLSWFSCGSSKIFELEFGDVGFVLKGDITGFSVKTG